MANVECGPCTTAGMGCLYKPAVIQEREAGSSVESIMNSLPLLSECPQGDELLQIPLFLLKRRVLSIKPTDHDTKGT